MTTTRVLLIRHGETDWNAAGRWQGHAPVPLNATGAEQARKLAAYLADQRTRNGTRFDTLYSSDLTRSMQTATAVAQALGLEVRPDVRLREVDLGEWQGLNRAETQAWDPERYAAFVADWYTVPPPGGESRNQLMARARAAFDDITAGHVGGSIALVSHGGTIGMLIESLFGHIDRPTLSNTSLTLVEQPAPGAAWRLVTIAETPHLTDDPIGETW
ncbi:MAG: histidine phosphatase family protein [Chloroflexi bacterium]|nr:histidine phosphatase family protein [Chloroflexota bacterium]